MRKWWILVLAVLLTVTCLLGCRHETEEIDISIADYVLDVQLMADSQSLIDEKDQSICYTVSNNSPFPVELREVLILSAFDSQGKALPVDGSSYSQSSLTLDSADDRYLQKTVSLHQATYLSEYVLDAAKSSETKERANTRDAAYTVMVAGDTAYADAIVRLDVLVLGKPQEYPYADWEMLNMRSQLLQGQEKPAAETVAAKKTVLPNGALGQSYEWDLYAGKALLLGRGSVETAELLIPDKIRLTKTEDGYCEDPIYGTTYDVVVSSNAFYDCKDIVSVTFEDGVEVENNSMCSTHGQGMFQNCTALTQVQNLPDTVLSMEKAFFGCTSMKTTPEFPAAVQSLKHTFRNCSALQSITPLPLSVTDMTGCFYDCKALAEVPVLPNGLKNLTHCFFRCALLESVPLIPDSVTDMTGCFSLCTNLKKVESLPASLKKLNSAFHGCTQLSQVPDIPDGTENMSGSFYGCQALTQIPKLPDSVTNMDATFENCTGITKLDRWPSSVKKITGCFRGCTNLASVPEIPQSVLDMVYLKGSMFEAFFGCDALEQLKIRCCDRGISANQITDVATVSFDLEHVTDGRCEGCHCISGTYDIEGIACTVTNMPEFIFEGFREFLVNEVPDLLKEGCKEAIFTTEELGRLTEEYSLAGQATGVFNGSEIDGIIWIDASGFGQKNSMEHLMDCRKFDPTDETQLREVSYDLANYYDHVIYHELAHCYDFREECSSTKEFLSHYAEIVGPICIVRKAYDESEYDAEYFAYSVEYFYSRPAWFRETCPGMYAYLESIFGSPV